MVFCCICGLEYRPGISLHRLPKNMERKSRWLASIEKKICNFSCSDRSVICNQHFEKDCFVLTATGKIYLKANSVPTIFNTPLRPKYRKNLDQHMQQPNIYDDIANTIKKLPINYLHEEPSSNKLITGTSTQNTNTMNSIPKVYTSIPKKQHITKLSVMGGKIESENVEVIYCDKDKSKLQRPKVYTSILKKQRITKLNVMGGKIESENGEVMDCNEDKGKLQRTLKEVTKFKKKVKVYQQKCRRLERKVLSLTLLIKHLQAQNLKYRELKTNLVS